MILKIQNKKTVEEILKDLDLKIRTKYHRIDELTDGEQLSFLVFKEEKIFEIWKINNNSWHFIKSFGLTAFSGTEGPKLRVNDHQIPEGIYEIEYLNPNSKYYLSLKINYPNDFDRKMAGNDKREFLGNDIFIHGGDKTIGCIPVGDEAIEEVFYLAAKNGHKNAKVIIAPYDMRVKEKAIDKKNTPWISELYSNIKICLSHYKK